MALLTGEYSCAMDEKGRVNFPSKMREKMGGSFIVTRWLDECLIAFPEDEWQRISELLSEKSVVKSRDIKRFLYSGAMEAAPDKQGRILITQDLRKHAALEKDIVVIGVGDHAEIWSADAWHKKATEFDSGIIAEAMEALDF